MHAGRFVGSMGAPRRAPPIGAASWSAFLAVRRNDLGLYPRQFRPILIVRHGAAHALWAKLYLGFGAAATSGALPLRMPD
jgi:hypothetical protein